MNFLVQPWSISSTTLQQTQTEILVGYSKSEMKKFLDQPKNLSVTMNVTRILNPALDSF